MKSTGVEVGADTGTETGPQSESQTITNVADTVEAHIATRKDILYQFSQMDIPRMLQLGCFTLFPFDFCKSSEIGSCNGKT